MLGYLIGIFTGWFTGFMVFKVAGDAWTNEVSKNYKEALKKKRG